MKELRLHADELQEALDVCQSSKVNKQYFTGFDSSSETQGQIVGRAGNWGERKRSWGGWETGASGKDRGAGGKLERAEKIVGRVGN